MMRTRVALVPLVLALFSSGCASWYDAQVATPSTYHAPQRLDDSYSISGRFLIVTAESKDYYGNYSWQRESGNDLLAFVSPLGNTVAQITIESGMATLVNSDGKRYSVSDLSTRMQAQLGFTLPLNYLHYWIQGVPLPQYPVQNQLASGFSQLDWQIEYLSWQDSNHPHILALHNRQMRIKMVIDWPESSTN